MSKAGVVKTQGYRKTRERADFGERVINGVVAVGKVCTKCGEWKDIDKCFSKKKGGLGGKRAVCTACEAVFCKIKVQSIAAKFPACNFTWRRGHDSLSRHASY
ncbi:hypothetical protein [Bacillus cereus]|uniref:hypothetical protein n=1 Tax=Bacillus cereus TaxID=1396 RepID=UPI003012FF78